MKFGNRVGFLAALLGSTIHSSLFAAGTVTTCDEASLRAALAGGGLVRFACDGTIVLTNTLALDSETELDGNGRAVRLSGGGLVRVLVSASNVVIRNLTICDGYISNLNGAGLYNPSNNRGKTLVADCTFSNNYVFNAGNGGGFGGAIAHEGGSLVVVRTAFINNRCDEMGSAISVNIPGGSASWFALTNCTFYGNASTRFGAAVHLNPPLPQSWIVNCTFASNNNNGIAVASADSRDKPLTLCNTIVAYSAVQDCISGSGYLSVPLVDGGHNIVSDSSPAITNATSLRNTDPLLGPLQDNGGPTWTAVLQTGSPGIDAAGAVVLPTDQRGFPRPYGGTSDIGACEWAPPFVIRGHVSGVTLKKQVNVIVDGTNTLATTNGFFTLVGQSAGTHFVEPSDPEYVFAPEARSVAVAADQLGVNFKAYGWNALSLDDVTNGVMHVITAATNGLTVRLQSSTDLRQWTSIGTNTIGPQNYWELFLPIGTEPAKFYRTVAP